MLTTHGSIQRNLNTDIMEHGTQITWKLTISVIHNLIAQQYNQTYQMLVTTFLVLRGILSLTGATNTNNQNQIKTQLLKHRFISSIKKN